MEKLRKKYAMGTVTKLEIRPIFHFNVDRIKSHISSCFVALKVFRELDRLLKKNSIRMSIETILNIAKTIQTITVKMDEGTLTKTLFLTKRQQLIKPLFEDTVPKSVKIRSKTQSNRQKIPTSYCPSGFFIFAPIC